MISRAILIISVLLAACCGSDQDSSHDTTSVTDRMVTDTIGVDTGSENYVFGDISGADTDMNGNLLVLDGVNCTVKVFTPEGDYAGSFGGSGSGPGEFLEPLALTVLSDGGIAVADWEAWGIYLFNSQHEYQGFLGPMPGGAPLALAGGADNSVTGLGLLFRNENDLTSGEYYLGSWSDLPEESFRFLEGPAEVVPGEGGEITINLPTVVFDSDSRGNLFAALSTDSTYIVHCYSAQGEELSRIVQNWEKVPLNDDMKLALEEALFLSGDTETEIPEFSSAIAGVFCQSDTRVWVRLGTSSSPVFHVYSSHGEFIDTVVCPDIHDPLFELDFHFSGSEVYVWNTDPVDYPKVLVMNNPLGSR